MKLSKNKLKYFSSQIPQEKAPFNRSEHMRLLHSQGRYVGTSKIGLWNISEERRKRMNDLMTKNALDKNSKGYGSEYHMRLNNRTLLHNKFQGDSGFVYFLKFPGSIKVGFSKEWERRVNYQIPEMMHIVGGKVIAIISGPTPDLADLEFNTFMKFKDYTQLNKEKTKYTEFMDLKVRKKVYEFLKEQVKNNKNLKFEIQNNLT